MGVLKSRRHESKAEYVNVGREIYTRTLNFLTKMTTRYSRLLSGPISDEAAHFVEFCIKANDSFPSDKESKELRKYYLKQAKLSLSSLDYLLLCCYDVMSLNPEGCFETKKESKRNNGQRKLDKMADKIGDLINKEESLLDGAIRAISDEE